MPASGLPLRPIVIGRHVGRPRSLLLAGLLGLAVGLGLDPTSLPLGAAPAGCADPDPAWLMCEDFEGGGAGWTDWFAASPFTECNGCSGASNDPRRIRLSDEAGAAHSGRWGLHMPAAAEAGFQGASLTWRDCLGAKAAGCRLRGHERLHFRVHVRLAEDHAYVHHFLELAGTRPDRYWESDGNAGCRPDGRRWAGTTLDFDKQHQLFFYTYFPGMRCDSGGYCSGDTARQICQGCAAKGMPCSSRQECCWGNLFAPEPAVTLPRGQWVCLELMMQLNSPGQADGRMAFWVNGRPALEVTGMHWRDIADLQLNKAWLMHYIAAGDAQQSNQVWFDDMVVSEEYIGCSDPDAPGLATPTSTSEAAPTATVAQRASATATTSPTAPVGLVTESIPAPVPIGLPWLQVP